MENLKLTFSNKNAAYTLKINDGNLLFENKQVALQETPYDGERGNSNNTHSGTVLSANQTASSDSTIVKNLENLDINTQIIGSADISDIDKQQVIGSADISDIDKQSIIGSADISDIDKQPVIGSADISDIDIKPTFDTLGRVYKITKGTNFEEGLKIGSADISDIDIKDVNPIFKLVNQADYEISLSYEYVEIVEQSTNLKQQFSICNNGLFINILGDELSLFKVKIS